MPEQVPVQPNLILSFAQVENPRDERYVRHDLTKMIVITICAAISGADSWVAVETFGGPGAKAGWLKARLTLGLRYGIPSPDRPSPDLIDRRVRPVSLIPSSKNQGKLTRTLCVHESPFFSNFVFQFAGSRFMAVPPTNDDLEFMVKYRKLTKMDEIYQIFRNLTYACCRVSSENQKWVD